ncbi:MAG: hypothetical protein WD232_08435 [Acidimicrobiales bacterium]
MTITEDEAADIAKRHGLGLSDAVSLRDLAADTDHAEALAARFAPGELTPDQLADAVERKQGKRQ